MEPKYPDICVPLSGEDGNVFFIMGRARKLARRAGVPNEELDQFTAEMTDGDYDHALRTVMKWFDTA